MINQTCFLFFKGDISASNVCLKKEKRFCCRVLVFLLGDTWVKESHSGFLSRSPFRPEQTVCLPDGHSPLLSTLCLCGGHSGGGDSWSAESGHISEGHMCRYLGLRVCMPFSLCDPERSKVTPWFTETHARPLSTGRRALSICCLHSDTDVNSHAYTHWYCVLQVCT